MHAVPLTPQVLRRMERTFTATVQNGEGLIIATGPLTLPAALALAHPMATRHGSPVLISNRTTPVLRISPAS